MIDLPSNEQLDQLLKGAYACPDFNHARFEARLRAVAKTHALTIDLSPSTKRGNWLVAWVAAITATLVAGSLCIRNELHANTSTKINGQRVPQAQSDLESWCEENLVTSKVPGIMNGPGFSVGYDPSAKLFWAIHGSTHTHGTWLGGMPYEASSPPARTSWFFDLASKSPPERGVLPQIEWDMGLESHRTAGYGPIDLKDAKGKIIVHLDVEPFQGSTK